jgi:WD40 repeat protein
MDNTEIAKKYEPKTPKVITAEPQVSLARFSPCGKVLVGGGYDARVRRWNMAAEGMPELPALEGHHGWVEGIAFRAEGELLLTADSWGQICC